MSTHTNEKRVQEIRERLKKTTDAEWLADPELDDVFYRMSDGTHFGSILKLGTHGTDDDLEFAAHAHQDINFLLSVIDAQKQQIEQNERLKEFVRAIVRTRCWGWDGETDGGTIQDEAEKYGIITPFECTQEHLDSGFLDPYEIEVGDTAYEFSDWMKKPPLSSSEAGTQGEETGEQP